MSSPASAPSDEFESLLGNMLGASGEAPGAAFTVSSLLGMMSGASPDVAAATTAVKARKGVNGMAGRQRPRKGVRAKPTEAHAAELPKEDDRSLDDLLRDLGEHTDTSAGSQKGKKKNFKQVQAGANGPDPAASPSKADIVMSEGAQQATKQPAPKATHEDTHCQALLEDEDELNGSAENWQVVPQKPTRRARVSAVSSTTSMREVPPEEAARARPYTEEETLQSMNTTALNRNANANKPDASNETCANQHSHERSDDGTTLASSQSSRGDQRPIMLSGSSWRDSAEGTSSEPQTARVPEERACAINTEVTAGIAVGKLEAAEAAMLARSDSDEAAAETPAASTWNCRPSVGTWFHPSPAFSRARRRSLSEGDRPFGMSGDSSEEESDGMGESGRAVTLSPHSGSWHLRPSVGTWLQTPRAQREPQLWPATPESTPPASPREFDAAAAHQGQVVWMPIPMHLVGEVQQLIRTRSMQGSVCT